MAAPIACTEPLQNSLMGICLVDAWHSLACIRALPNHASTKQGCHIQRLLVGTQQMSKQVLRLNGILQCRAFALEGRGIWHALSASVTQQVIGPVRARADFRYALDLPSSIPQVHSLRQSGLLLPAAMLLLRLMTNVHTMCAWNVVKALLACCIIGSG